MLVLPLPGVEVLGGQSSKGVDSMAPPGEKVPWGAWVQLSGLVTLVPYLEVFE
jgi:hypothetical protein